MLLLFEPHDRMKVHLRQFTSVPFRRYIGVVVLSPKNVCRLPYLHTWRHRVEPTGCCP
jgi:hypothetical protein